MPLSDIITTAQSSDGSNHTVSIYFDISGEWASGLTGANNQPAALINWAPETINRNADGTGTQGTLSTWTVMPTSPMVFTQSNDDADWGTVLWSTETTSGLTTQSGADVTVRNQFVGSGVLANTNDTNQPRAINDADAAVHPPAWKGARSRNQLPRQSSPLALDAVLAGL
jgi:hypothetical protein